jgi:hypothetical protein
MKSFKEFLITESRSAPLYHWTSIKNFPEIIKSNTLKGTTHAWMRSSDSLKNINDPKRKPWKSISFTRDYDRQFLPGRGSGGKEGSIAFRVDQQKLHQYTGKKMKAAVNRAAMTYDKLDDKDKADVDHARETGDYSKVRGRGINSTDLEALAKGTAQLRNRFESEERVLIDEIPNFKKYITGIVLSGDNKQSRLGNTEQMIAIAMIKKFSGKRGYDLRNMIIDHAIKLNVPLIYNRMEGNPKKVKQEMINLFMLKKKSQDQFNQALDTVKVDWFYKI